MKVRPLKRIRAGHYVSRCGRWAFYRDPTGGDQPGGWGWGSWLVFDLDDGTDEASFVGGNQHHRSLVAAVRAVEDTP